MSDFPRVGPETIRDALRQHRKSRGEQGWPEAAHVELAEQAEAAFAHGNANGFQGVYDHLRSYWQVFRRAARHWSSDEVFTALWSIMQDKSLSRYARLRLSDLEGADAVPVWGLLGRLRPIKTLARGGDSVVAISKFLHFFNPRLFLIVDDAVMWNHVLDHWWLWVSFQPCRERIRETVAPGEAAQGDRKCDVVSYLGVLFWARDILARCPDLLACYRRHLVEVVGLLPGRAEDYDALAVEWFLLGLVELPPRGFGE